MWEILSMPKAHFPEANTMPTKVHTGLDAPEGIWWKPAHRAEKVWVAIAFARCMVLFAMMPLWHWRGGQNPSGIRRKVEPRAFYCARWSLPNSTRSVKTRGLPIVQPPARGRRVPHGAHLPVVPILQLVEGETYRLHLSALDVNHGFSLYPLNVNFAISRAMTTPSESHADDRRRLPHHLQQVLRNQPTPWSVG
ncbi:MAG: hypothetical protein IPK33_20190 [Gemmatimonadetes bacterium]|nr:hypothetical protein [Gemmatimonadota bacterium]